MLLYSCKFQVMFILPYLLGGIQVQDVIICRCEEVSLAELEKAAKQFNSSARELKLRTRAGMGFCGGRTCRPAVDKVLSQIAKLEPTDAIPLKVQPPVRPISLAELAQSGGEVDDK